MIPGTYPPEVWIAIFTHLEFDQLKVVSLVSKYLRNVSAQLLFKTVTLQFGKWRSEEERIAQEDRPDGALEADLESTGHAQSSLDVLLCLQGGGAIASAVVTLKIYAFATIYENLIFEAAYIERALKHMKNLCRFDWYAGNEVLPAGVIQALATHCPYVNDITIVGLDKGSMPSLNKLRHLRALRLVDENAHDEFGSPEVDHPPEPDDLSALFRRHGRHMEEFAIPGNLAEQALRFAEGSSLAHLAITNTNANICERGLGRFLKNAQALKSLIVIDCYDFSFLPITEPGAERALPNLQDLKLYLRLPTSHNGDAPTARDFVKDSQRLLDFTTLHDDLRRFDFSVEPVENGMSKKSLLMDTAFNDEWFPNVVRAAQKITQAQAVGLSFPRLSTGMVHSMMTAVYEDVISYGCKAIRLGGVSEVPYLPLVDDLLWMIKDFSFIGLSNKRPLEREEDIDEGEEVEFESLPNIADLARRLPYLQLAQLNSRFFSVSVHHPRVRPPAGPSTYRYDPLETVEWSSEDIRFRTVDDFPSEDAYWLMSYRHTERRPDFGYDSDDEHAMFI